MGEGNSNRIRQLFATPESVTTVLSAHQVSDAKLADRTAKLQNAPHQFEAAPSPQPDAKPASPKPQDRKAGPKLRDATGSPGPAPNSDVLVRVRQDLSEAQRSRGLIETRLQSVTEDLQKLKVQSSLDSKRIRDLTKESTTLTRGLKDRDEELKGKAKLVEVGCVMFSINWRDLLTLGDTGCA